MVTGPRRASIPVDRLPREPAGNNTAAIAYACNMLYYSFCPYLCRRLMWRLAEALK